MPVDPELIEPQEVITTIGGTDADETDEEEDDDEDEDDEKKEEAVN